MISLAKPSYNPPQWADAIVSGKNYGYWYCWHDGKKHNLSRFGAVREPVKPGSKAYVAGVSPAYALWIEQQEALQDKATAVAPTAVVTVADVANLYMNSISGRKSEKMIRYWLGKFVKVFGRLRATDLTKGKIETYLRANKWKISTVKTVLTPVRSAFNHAVAEGLIEKIPYGKLHLTTTNRTGHFSVADEIRFVNCINNQAYRDFFSACMDTGARPGEIANLKAENVVGETWVLTEWKNSGKTGKLRTIYLSDKWIRWTAARLEEMGQGEYLFRTQRRAKWTTLNWGVEFRKTLAKAGLKGLCMYSVRHTHITRSCVAGVPTALIAAACGTSQAIIERHYNETSSEKEALKAYANRAG